MPDFNEILFVDAKKISPKKVFPKRKARIEEAMAWSTGNEREKKYHDIWEKDGYRVALGKPGKEALPGYNGKINPNDMKPTIFLNDVDMEKSATFQDIVKDLEEVGRTHPYALQLVGCLLFRSAFLLDHEKIEPNSAVIHGDSQDIYRYKPSQAVIDKICETIPSIYGVPVDVFLHYLDAIALNEDVKYSFLGHDLGKKSTGGRNNMLTYVNLIAVISGKKPLYKLAGPLLRSGVSAISQKEAFNSLPHIANNVNQANS